MKGFSINQWAKTFYSKERVNMYYFKYDLIDSDIKYGVKKHPQEQMKELGFIVVKSQPFTIGDCWIFETTNKPKNLPGYLREIKHFEFD